MAPKGTQLMTHATNVYIAAAAAAAYLAIMLLSLLAYCIGKLIKRCVYHLDTAKVDTYFLRKACG